MSWFVRCQYGGHSFLDLQICPPFSVCSPPPW